MHNENRTNIESETHIDQNLRLVPIDPSNTPEKMQDVMKDNCYMVHSLFLLFGIIHLLPVNFFVTANEYWMYKFRNVSLEKMDPNNRSLLQANFASGSIIAQSIPTIIFMLLTTIFGYKVRVRTRVVATLYILIGCLATSTGFIKVNTDDWQYGFFAYTMATLAVMNGSLAIFQVSSLVLVSKFPAKFMKIFLVGQGIGGILGSSLEVIAISVGTSVEASALIYFILGTILTGGTLFLYFHVEQLNFYQYYIEHSVEDTKKDLITFQEVQVLSRKIWTSLIIVMAGALAYVPTHPAVAVLVNSEHQDNSWNKTYFVPVVTFLYSDICSVIGRLLAAKFSKSLSDPWLAILSITRMIIFVPLFMLCNAHPRHNLPVLFPHDWQYIIILGSFMVSNGYLFNIGFLNISRLAPKQEDTAYMIMQTCIGIVGALFSPLGVICVNLL